MRKNRIDRKCEICSKEYTSNLAQFKNGILRFCSRNCAMKSRNWKGKNNPNWKGGNWTSKSKEIKIRDNYTCQICGLVDVEIMDVDHIKPKKLYPELLLDDNNLMTICPNCHKRKTLKEYMNKKQLEEARLNIKSVPVWEQK